MKQRDLKIIIKNISEGKQKGYMATFPDLKKSIVFGGSLKELGKGIQMVLADEPSMPNKKSSIPKPHHHKI